MNARAGDVGPKAGVVVTQVEWSRECMHEGRFLPMSVERQNHEYYKYPQSENSFDH